MDTALRTLIYGIIDGAILAMPSVGFSLQFGVTNYVNFAYGAFITLGAFWGMLIGRQLHAGFWISLIGAGVIMAFISFVVGVGIYSPFSKKRPQLLFGLVLTFSAWLIVDNIMVAIWGENYYTLPSANVASRLFHLGPVPISSFQLEYVAIALVLLGALYGLLHHTRFGISMRATSDDTSLASVCGLNLLALRGGTWLITGFVAGVSGVVLANQTGSFTTGLGDEFIYLVVAATILGGIGRPEGAVLGALIIGLTSDIAVPLIGAALSPALIFAVLLALMGLRPGGVFGAVGRGRFGNA